MLVQAAFKNLFSKNLLKSDESVVKIQNKHLYFKSETLIIQPKTVLLQVIKHEA